MQLQRRSVSVRVAVLFAWIQEVEGENPVAEKMLLMYFVVSGYFCVGFTPCWFVVV